MTIQNKFISSRPNYLSESRFDALMLQDCITLQQEKGTAKTFNPDNEFTNDALNSETTFSFHFLISPYLSQAVYMNISQVTGRNIAIFSLCTFNSNFQW